jgi:transcriptional regulator with XRE-family HTH domain
MQPTNDGARSTFPADVLACELVRALRGRRSQTALSRRLGYRSNVVYLWESGRRAPSASELFRIVARTGGDPRRVLAGFPVDVSDLDLTEPHGVGALLGRLRGSAKAAEVARRCAVSRSVASRWLNGKSEPRLAELLALVEVLTLRGFDFVAAVAPPDRLPSLAPRWREQEARRRVALELPWSSAVLRLLETADYRARPRTVRWMARRLGISEVEVGRSLDALRRAGLVEALVGGGASPERYVVRPVAVDTSAATETERRALKLHWTDVGRERLSEGKPGLFSWSVFAISREDFARLQALHVDYLQALRRLVDASEPTELVAVANVQLFALDGRS